MSRILKRLGAIEKHWNRFWFETDGRAQVRLFRKAFGMLLFACYLVRSLDLGLYYGANGIVPVAILPELLPMDYRYSVFNYFTGGTALWLGNGIFLTSLVTLALGVLPRWSAGVALALHVSFVHRNPAVAYGVDSVASFYLFFLCFADFRQGESYRPRDLQAALGSMSFRLAQIQLCVIYGYSGLKKLKGGLWWSGDALWASLAQVQLTRWDFSWLAHFPILLACMTFLTLAWEIYFPAVIWYKPLRTPVLLTGVFMHAGIAMGLNLPFFGALMVTIYAYFLSPSQVAWAERISQASKIKLTFSKVPRPVAD